MKKAFATFFLVIFLAVAFLGSWSRAYAANSAKSTAGSTVASAGLASTFGGISCLTRMVGSLSGMTYAGWGSPALGVATSECANDILKALWKTVIFKLIRQVTLNLVTKGDFGMSWDEIQDWFYKDVVFQAAELVLNKLGLSLCTRFSLSVQIALYQSVATGYYEPSCTFDQSEFAQIIDDAFTKGNDAALARIRKDFWSSFSVTTQPQQNEFSNFWVVKNAITEQRDQKQDIVARELSYSVGGVLGQRECKEDPKNPGTIDPTTCKVKTPGMMVSQVIMGDYAQAKDASFKSTAMADMGALLGEVLDIVVNQAVTGGVEKFEGWRKGQVEDAARDYNKASQ